MKTRTLETAGASIVYDVAGDLPRRDRRPPLFMELPDREDAQRALQQVRDAYAAGGFGAGMAAFIAMTSWQAEFTDFARPTPDSAKFGLPTEDDGSRDDPLLSDRSTPVTSYHADFETLSASPARITVAVGKESAGTLTARTATATAEHLDQQATVFPSHDGCFNGPDSGYPGQPEAFAATLRQALADG